MSCRETAAGSMFTSWAHAHAGSDLSDQAILATFHQLRRNYLETDEATRAEYSDERYQDLLNRQEARIRNAHAAGEITERRRDSLLERLQRARSENPTQDARYAMFNLVPAVRNRAQAWNAVAGDIAIRTGQTRTAVLEHMRADRSGRTSRNTDLPEGAMERAVALGLPRDAGSVYAWAMAEATAVRAEVSHLASQPQRITREPVHVPLDGAGLRGVTATEVGYDERSGRFEIVTHDAGTGETTTRAYRNVPADVAAGGADAWAQRIRGNPDYQYDSEIEAAREGVARRCSACGQFAGAGHSCPPQPVRFAPYDHGTRWTAEAVPHFYVDPAGAVQRHDASVRLPAIRRLQQGANSGAGAQISWDRHQSVTYIDEDSQWMRGIIHGSTDVGRDENGDLVINTEQTRCTCAQYQNNGHCPHVDLVAEAIRTRIDRPGAAERAQREEDSRDAAVRAAAERIGRMADEARARDWSQDPTALADAERQWRTESDVLYSRDEQAFREDIEAALTARAAKGGQPDIPYMRENALDGMAQRGSGQGFGMEIEFTLSSNLSYPERAAALQSIARDLHQAGLTRTPDQERYGYSRHFGFVDSHYDSSRGTGTWCFEHDGSVDGELVTPVMYDEPETWAKLETAVEIIKRHGGVASSKAGAHVHVGTGNYGDSPATYTELARIVNQHEDVVTRLASDPQRGTHRNNGYSRPLPDVPVQGFSDVSQIRSWQHQRYSMVNFAHVTGTSGDHPEFRVFDSTLDPGAMQAQVKLAVGMTHAAQRAAQSGGTTRGREQWGDHVRREAGAAPAAGEPTVQGLMEGSGTVRSLLDTLFRRREDKAQLAAVYANTSWNVAPRA